MERKKHIYTEQEAYLKLSALCAMSEQCCYDVMKKMKRWEVADEVAERIVAKLVKEKFIDVKGLQELLSEISFAIIIGVGCASNRN